MAMSMSSMPSLLVPEPTGTMNTTDNVIWVTLSFLPSTTASQGASAISDEPSTATHPTATLISGMTPSAVVASPSSTGPDSSQQTSTNGQGKDMINYYFIFFALLLSIGGLGAFLLVRRRRRLLRLYASNRQRALAQDVNGWDPMRAGRRYWQGRARSAEISREEGLNEHGEAPPPYMSAGITTQTANQQAQAEVEHREPAVPLQTLSRQQAGLKPPDYEETTREVAETRRGSTVSDPSNVRHGQQ